MNFDPLAILSVAISLVALAVTLASLPDHGWNRLGKWWGHISLWATRLWCAVALIASVVGIVAFGVGSGQPSRTAILMLLLHCFNLIFYLALSVLAIKRESGSALVGSVPLKQ